jgi:tetraacyldisaccharide 4'-kinase
VVLGPASLIYGAAMRWRQRWYAGGRGRQRRLARPVVSVGNLRVGGAGKTPVVAYLARLLSGLGERPAILSRGYGRRRRLEGVTVVSDGERIAAGLDVSGDEPLMLARALPGVPVLVGTDRFLSGRLAERLGATIHILDDGFQHLALARDLDLLLVDEADLSDRLLPAGWLRETVDASARADAVLTSPMQSAAPVRQALGVDRLFGFARAIGAPRWIEDGALAPLSPSDPLLAVAGIARPERFFGDLRDAGWRLAGTRTFRDHHPFSGSDLEKLADDMRVNGATAMVTTEKDAVRFQALAGRHLPIAYVPLTITIEPDFDKWLMSQLRVRQ